jgi:hypothetical protein
MHIYGAKQVPHNYIGLVYSDWRDIYCTSHVDTTLSNELYEFINRYYTSEDLYNHKDLKSAWVSTVDLFRLQPYVKKDRIIGILNHINNSPSMVNYEDYPKPPYSSSIFECDKDNTLRFIIESQEKHNAPIVVLWSDQLQSHLLLDGHNRVEAAYIGGLTKIPAYLNKMPTPFIDKIIYKYMANKAAV